MAIESWMNPDEVADLAAHATAMVDAALVGTDLSRTRSGRASARATTPPTTTAPKKAAAPAVVAEVIPVVLEDSARPWWRRF